MVAVIVRSAVRMRACAFCQRGCGCSCALLWWAGGFHRGAAEAQMGFFFLAADGRRWAQIFFGCWFEMVVVFVREWRLGLVRC